MSRLSGWTHTYQHPLRIRKFVVGSKEVPFSKISPISGFTVFNTQDLGDFVTIWHDGDFHHYSKTGVFLSKGAFPFAIGVISIHPNLLKIPTLLPEDEDFTPVCVLQSDSDDKIDIEESKSRNLKLYHYQNQNPKLYHYQNQSLKLYHYQNQSLKLYHYQNQKPKCRMRRKVMKQKKKDKPEPESIENQNLKVLNQMLKFQVSVGGECDLDLKPDAETLKKNSGWHDNSDIIDNTITFVNILPEMNLGNKDLVFDFSVITLATEDTPYKILQNDDEMIIKKVRIDDVFKKYSCTLTNERSFRPQIRYLLSNFQLDFEDISEFELFVGEYDEPLLMRMKVSSGYKTFVHRGDNKWETLDIKFLDINTLDQNYILLRDDITMIDCSKKSGHYLFGKYKIQVNELEAPNQDRIEGFKTYIHTIYQQTDTGTEFASPKVHRFKYDTTALGGFVRYHSVRKVCVHFWKHELTRPVYIRVVADHGFGNYFGYPNYILQTDISSFSYFLSVTNFEVNNALVINLARHENYDFEGGISLHLTRHQVTVKVFENSPFPRFRRNVHTLTVGNVNKPFSILRFLNEPGVTVDPTKVSSLEAYYHNNHLKKPLLVILNGSSRQSFFKLENDSFVKIDYLLFNLEVTLKYLEYHNYNYVTLNVSKTTAYHYTGTPNPSSMPDRNLIVSVDKDDLSEFSKYTQSIKVDNKPSKFKLIGLEGVDIRLDDPEITSMASYFHNEHAKTPLAIVLKSITDVLFVKKGDYYIKRPYRNVDQSLDILRSLVQLNLGIVYLKLDQKSHYYTTQDDGLKVEVSRGDISHEGYTHFVHKFPKSKEFRFLNGTNYFHPKVDQGQFEKADVFVDGSNFPTVVSLYGAKGTGCHFIFQNDGYKKAKLESVERKLSSQGQKETQPQAQPESQPGSQTPLIKPPPKPSIKPKQVKSQPSSQPSTPGQSQTPTTRQSPRPKQDQAQRSNQDQTLRPKQDQSPKPGQPQSSSQPLPKPKSTPDKSQKPGQTLPPKPGQTQPSSPGQAQLRKPAQSQPSSKPPTPGQSQTPKTGQSQTPKTGQSQAPKTGQSKPPKTGQSKAPKTGQTQSSSQPSRKPTPTPKQDQPQKPSAAPTTLLKPSVTPTHTQTTKQPDSTPPLSKPLSQPVTPPQVPKPPPSMAQSPSQPVSQTKLIKPSVPSSQSSQDQTQTKLIKPSVPSSQSSQDQTQTKLIKPSVPSSQSSQDQTQTKLIKPSVPSSQSTQDQTQTKLIKPSVTLPPKQDQTASQLPKVSQPESQPQSQQQTPPPLPKVPSSRDQ
ncbi:hypothetical protein MACK_004130 [Theileria orientalis]|uniref:Uncharacterized protein n=1 Tax=Theileria orientalis TaxID=68886 RepID=A0A976SJW1_THEOR|nr:hypothetical protein MACK_004130 [Theileria orientalis]